MLCSDLVIRRTNCVTYLTDRCNQGCSTNSLVIIYTTNNFPKKSFTHSHGVGAYKLCYDDIKVRVGRGVNFESALEKYVTNMASPQGKL